MEELVSIIMPSYETARYLEEAVRSVISQTYPDWELLIVDDGSSDHTDEVVGRLKEKRIRYFKAKRNLGAAACRNKALREAKGRWIAFLDSDDVWYPEKLERQLAFMKKRRIYFSYTAYEEIDADSQPLGIIVSGPGRIRKNHMKRYCWPGCLTVMYDQQKAGCVQAVNIRKNNDYAMWLFISRRLECYLLPEVLAKYRRRSGSVSDAGCLSLIKWHYRLFRDGEKRSVPAAAACVVRNLFFGMVKKCVYVTHEKRKYKIVVFAHTGKNKTLLNGQTVKSKYIILALQKEYGRQQVRTADTSQWKQHPLRLVMALLYATKQSKNVIIMPAENGIRVFVPFLGLLSGGGKAAAHYIVTGGWLPEFLEQHKWLVRFLTKFDGIYAEAASMVRRLNQAGCGNVFLLRNFKRMEPVKLEKHIYQKPYKVCTFSRITAEKGIETAVRAVLAVNRMKNDTFITLDIYGQIADGYKSRFMELLSEADDAVTYKGEVAPDKSVDVLRTYDALLFPTYYPGEGVPGTVIDAFFAGVPVIASDWRYNREIITDRMTGIIYKDDRQLEQYLLRLDTHTEELCRMARNCIAESEKYTEAEFLETIRGHIR